MRNRRTLWLFALVLAISLLTVACGGGQSDTPPDSGGSGSSGEKIVLKLAHEDPPDNQWGMGATHFAELVAEKSGGQIEIQIYDNGQLGHGVDNIQQLQTAALEMCIVGGDLVSIDPFFKVFDLPYLFRDRDHAKQVLGGEGIVETANSKLENHGLVLLGFWENGFRQITNSQKPIVVPDDLKGMKIRVPENEVRVAMFSLYGANPTAMAFSELYTALQQGVIQAQENPYGNIWGDKLFEVQKYISRSNHVFTPINVLISKEVWDGLPEDAQAILKEAAMETGPWQMDWIAGQEDGWIQDMVDYGCEFNDIDLDAFVEASQPIWDDIVAELGPDAQSLMDEIVNTK